MGEPEEAEFPEIPYAFEIDDTIRNEIGGPGMLEKIFTKEKIADCQEMIEEAKASFFDTSLADMEKINELTGNEKLKEDYRAFCRQVYRPVSNIRGQAKIFGYPLIDRICGYIQNYCETANAKKMTPKDVFIIGKLVEALQRSFQEKIIDQGGVLEKDLIDTIEKANKTA